MTDARAMVGQRMQSGEYWILVTDDSVVEFIEAIHEAYYSDESSGGFEHVRVIHPGGFPVIIYIAHRSKMSARQFNDLMGDHNERYADEQVINDENSKLGVVVLGRDSDALGGWFVRWLKTGG